MKNIFKKAVLVLTGVGLFCSLLYACAGYFRDDMQATSIESSLPILTILLLAVVGCALIGRGMGIVGFQFIVILRNLSILHTAVMLFVCTRAVPFIFFLGLIASIFILIILTVIIFHRNPQKSNPQNAE